MDVCENFNSVKTPTERKILIAVTMATSRQGIGVVNELSRTNRYKIRALTRNMKSSKAKDIAKLPNVELTKGDLLDRKSLNKAFHGVEAIFGNTTPTTGWKIFKGSINRDYEIEQGKNLINEVRIAYKKGLLTHFVFSSICKAKNPLKNDPAPSHFSSKWDIEEYIKINNLEQITTILRPVSYFENFETKIPGLNISTTIFPGIIQKDLKWQTIAVDDIGKWVRGVLYKSDKYKNKAINIASEEMTGTEMAETLQSLINSKSLKINYLMIPRPFIRAIESDIAIMADWIERAGYGAEMSTVKEIQNELNIKPISLKSWLLSRLIKYIKSENIDPYTCRNSKLNLK